MARERNTVQKQAIVATFAQHSRPLTVTELHTMATSRCASLGIATVYRAVNRLLEIGWLVEVRLPDQPVRYECAAMEHHHHFHCQVCERVLDIKVPCQSISETIPNGFMVHRHELTFYGICNDCTASQHPSL